MLGSGVIQHTDIGGENLDDADCAGPRGAVMYVTLPNFTWSFMFFRSFRLFNEYSLICYDVLFRYNINAYCAQSNKTST